MIEMSRQQLADLRGCTATTVSKHKLPKLKNGKYDLQDSEVWAFVTDPTIQTALREEARKNRRGKVVDDLHMLDLEEEKLREDIEYKRRQSRKLDLQHEREKKNLIPVELMAIWIGHFASGVKTNFLPIGNRVARGDTKLRNRIEKEIAKAIKKTKQGAASALKKECAQISKSLEDL